jgi:RNA-dependent RNA polymerase
VVGLFWDPKIVKNFRNSSSASCAPPIDIEEQFDLSIEPMDKYMERVAGLSSSEELQELQKHLLSGLADRKVGLYSRFHSLSTYKLGYGDPVTIRLAHM